MKNMKIYGYQNIIETKRITNRAYGKDLEKLFKIKTMVLKKRSEKRKK